jgi:hypothetical protein
VRSRHFSDVDLLYNGGLASEIHVSEAAGNDDAEPEKAATSLAGLARAALRGEGLTLTGDRGNPIVISAATVRSAVGQWALDRAVEELEDGEPDDVFADDRLLARVLRWARPTQPAITYFVFSYGDRAAPRNDQREHGEYTDRVEAESECRRLVLAEGRRSAHVKRGDHEGDIVYLFDQTEAATYAVPAGEPADEPAGDWPPAFFGAAPGDGRRVADTADDDLAAGFGQA